MTNPFADRRSSLADARHSWVAADREYHSAASEISLIAELEVAPARLDDLLDSLRVLSAQQSARARADVARGAIALAVVLPKFCQIEYRDAAFWPHLWARLEVTEARRQALQVPYGDIYLDGLQHARLPVFRDVGRRYLDNVLMHAGVPDALLADWFELLDLAARAVTSDPNEVTHWLRDRVSVGGLTGFDVPLRRFVAQGGPFAADLIERGLGLLAAVRSGNDLDPVGVGLPASHVEAAQKYCSGRPQVGSGAPPRRAAAPALRLIPEEGRVVLALPQMADVVDTLRWQIRVEQRTLDVVPPRLWGGDRVEFAGVQVPIDTPARFIEVSAVGMQRSNVISVVHDELPLLAFDRSGSQIDVEQGLPMEPVWLLTPPAAGPPAPPAQLSVADGHALSDLGSPLGWGGWTLAMWDLGAATGVTLGDQAIPLSSRARAQVQTADDSYLEAGSIAGQPLHSRRPEILLPRDATWTVEITDYETGEVLQRTRVPPGVKSLDPFRDWPAPVVGAFTVVVRGPLGRGAARTFGMAEGLTLRVEPKFRTFTRDGLRPASVAIGMPGSQVLPPTLTFGPGDRLATAMLVANGRQARLAVMPPTLAVTTQPHGQPPLPWRTGSITVQKEGLSETNLLLRIGLNAAPQLTVCRNSTVLQRLEPSSVTAGRNVSYALSRILDTVEQGGANALLLGKTQDDPGVLVSRIIPGRLATDIEADESGLRLTSPGSSDLEVALWSTGEPWEPPRLRAVAQGVIELEPGERMSGRIVAVPRLRDIWSLPEPLPRFPYRGTMLVSDPVLPDPDAAPSDKGTPISRAWAALLLDVVLPAEYQSGETELAQAALAADPAQALLSILEFGLPPIESAAALLRTGIAAAPGNAQGEDPAIAAHLRRDPVAAALVYMPLLIGRSEAFPEARIAARDVLGEAAISFMDSGVDEFAQEGAFGDNPSVQTLDRLREAQRARFEEILSSMGLRPVGLLHPDNRLLQSVEVLDRRRNARPRSLALDAEKVVVTVVRSLRTSGFEVAAQSVEKRGRRPGKTWENLSAASLAWSIALRYGSRGHQLQQLRPLIASWRDSAHAIAPLQAIDLVLAEIHASRDFPLNQEAL